MVACFYTVEQWSAINNLSIASALQLSRSGLCNLNLCVTSGGMQKVIYSYLSAFVTSCALVTMFRCDRTISRIGSRH